MPEVAQSLQEEFGRAVKRARSLKGWTLDQLANAMAGNPKEATGKSFLSAIENGKRAISPRTVGKLIKALDLPEGWIDRFLDAEPDEVDEITPTDQVADHLLTMAAEDKGLPTTAEGLLIGLAQTYARDNFVDHFSAYTALRSTLQADAEQRTKLDRVHNLDGRLSAILRRVADLNDQNRRDEAGAILDAAIKAKEAELDSLQDAALHQDRLLNDPRAAANRALERLRAETKPKDLFSAMHNLLEHWREEGSRQADPFSLKVALALARHNYFDKGENHAHSLFDLGVCQLRVGEGQLDPKHLYSAAKNLSHAAVLYQKKKDRQNWGTIQTTLGFCYFLLGSREQNTTYLQKSIVACEAALTVRNRAQDPTGWAKTKVNLGIASRALAKLTGDLDQLLKSREAFQSSLDVFTRESAPFEWAKAKMGLGIALRDIGDRNGSDSDLLAAIAAIDDALTVFTLISAPVDWATAKGNRGVALRVLCTLSGNSSHFDAARQAFSDCLRVWTKESTPLPWATTQLNLADLALARQAIWPDPALLVTAQHHLSLAREVIAEAGNDHHLAECDRLQALIDAA